MDSILKRAEEGSMEYGDALFWRGALAQTAAEAESDYRRVIVEYPLSHYADDALLAIVELEQARGDRVGALAHLQRFVREHPVSSARGIAALAAARLAFDQRDNKVGCSMITEARASVAATDVELRNQIDYYGGKCVGAPTDIAAAPVAPSRDTTTASKAVATSTIASKKSPGVPSKASKADTVAKATKAAPIPPKLAVRDTTSKPAPTPVAHPTPPIKAKGNYTIQLAAYGTRTDAEQLVKKLEGKGVRARVSGEVKPFRVRLDFYPTRQAALAEVASLKERGIIGFVTEERPPAGKSP